MSPELLKYTYVTLLFICISCAAALALEMSRHHELITVPVTTENQVSNKEQSNKKVTKTVTPLEDYTTVVERPLFMSDRRPYVPQQTSVQAPAKPQRQERKTNEQFLLSAVIITDDTRIALIQSSRDKKLQKLRQGDEYQGWELTEISPESVSLTKGSETKRLDLLVVKSANSQKAKKNNEKQSSGVTIENTDDDVAVEPTSNTEEIPAE